MDKLPAYGPPGRLTDLDETGRKRWNAFISTSVDQAIRGPDPRDVRNDSPRPQFYNLTRMDTPPDAKVATVSWTAFPRQIKISSPSDTVRWRRADASRDVQDEYCEWSVTRDPTTEQVTRVTFTCEGPEYWDLLAQTPETLLALYRKYISADVQMGDLYASDGAYQPRNRWNNSTTDGAMHLVQRANTLGAEIELAAAATIRRVIDGRELTTEQELINCGKYGVATRNSDPHIGGAVNALARTRAFISLTDPVGLYIGGLATDGWTTPDGSDPADYWTILRGDATHPVRAVYEVPPARGFTVSDIRINGTPIRFGAQIADFITIQLSAVACRPGESTAEPQTACKESVAADAESLAPFTAEAMAAHGRLGIEPGRARRITRLA